MSMVSVPVPKLVRFPHHDVRNLTEWLNFDVLGGLVFAIGEIDEYELIGDILLFACQCNETGACGHGVTVEFEDHGNDNSRI